MSKARDLANAGTALTSVSATELGYVDGVTSAIQTQINSKIGSASAINPTIVDAKGDIIAATAADTPARLAVGSNNTVLTADSAEATGLKWATPTSSSTSWSLLNSGGTALTGAQTVTVSSISGYNSFMVLVSGASSASAGSQIQIRLNGISTSKYYNYGQSMNMLSTYAASNLQITNAAANGIYLGQMSSVANSIVSGYCMITGANQATVPVYQSLGAGNAPTGNSNTNWIIGGYFDNNATVISSISLFSDTGNFDAGTLFIYGSTI